MSPGDRQRLVYFVAFVVVSLSVAGYFTGLQSPMRSKPHPPENSLLPENRKLKTENSIPATHYTKMPEVMKSLRNRTRLASLKSTVDPLAKFEIDPKEKKLALKRREQNRAYNGAPPTIPHPINQISDASCVACHEGGIKTESLRVSRMSHQFLSNCTQCHVENSPGHLKPIVFRENHFDGVDAPEQGPRAFPGAPPQIPHATWMRSDCMSCHGDSGLHGIRTTHPWRNNCQQCHAPSAALDQTFLAREPKFLPAPKIAK